MMRLRSASLGLVAACVSLFAGVAGTGVAQAQQSASSSTWRSLALSASPAPSDLELMEVGFPRTHGRRQISRAVLTLAVSGALGADYVTLATSSFERSRSPRALVLVVNRPSALLDPTTVRLRLRALRVLGTPVLRRIVDPLTHPRTGLTPALCDLPLHGAAALGASGLRTVASRGAALTGFGAAAAVAQAYDVVCGLPHLSSFEQAVRQGACGQSGTLCCPPTAICATPPQTTPPTPAPPVPTPGPPGCTPCNPAPGYACPLAKTSVCAASLSDGRRRASPGAH
ncbi:MAG: hypothetical protein ACYDHN_04565 [Solirubrobacteraceae bacterium]